VPRIVVHDPRPDAPNWAALLAAPGHEIVVCTNRECVVGAIAAQRPDLLLYVLADLEPDVWLLAALRERGPNLPIVLLDGPEDLEDRRLIQELQPTFYGQSALAPVDLCDVVRGALRRGSERVPAVWHETAGHVSAPAPPAAP